MAKIYLSSTYSHLQPFRDRVHAVVRQRGHIDVSVAGDQRSPDTALEALRACDLYIGIIAWNRMRIEIGEPEKAEILRRVSKYMLEHWGPGPDVNVIRPDPLMHILAEYIEAGYKQAPADARVTARQILAHLRERTYILAEIGEDRFGFVHRTFMEYFAADTCLKDFNASGAAFDHLIDDLFGPHWQRDPATLLWLKERAASDDRGVREQAQEWLRLLG